MLASISCCFVISFQIWNNIISLSFGNDEFTTTWRNTFTRDFEGKFQQVWTNCFEKECFVIMLPHEVVFHCKCIDLLFFCLQEERLDQVDVYCSKMEDLNNSHPHIAKSIEKCALEAVTALCQVFHFKAL